MLDTSVVAERIKSRM